MWNWSSVTGRGVVGKIIGEIMTEKFPKSFKNYKTTDQEIQ